MASQKAYAYGAFISRLCIYITLQNLKLLTRQLVVLYFMGNILKKALNALYITLEVQTKKLKHCMAVLMALLETNSFVHVNHI